MSQAFDYFVVFAEIRTGSNFLEANLNTFDGLSCYGEAFNPAFIGYPGTPNVLGVTQTDRDAHPDRLLKTIHQFSDGLGGFRYFHDHDPRVLDAIIDDPRCAKIVLTRNPLESYVSLKIAQETGQWKLTHVRARKAARAQFDAAEFETHLSTLQGFQIMLMNRLQVSGQTAFYVDYEDLQSVEVMNGLAKWLGVEARITRLDGTLKPQNPGGLPEKVKNPADMADRLGQLDRFNLSRTPNFEPRRGPSVPSYVAAPQSGLLYLPVRGGPEAQVRAWLAALDGADEADLQIKMNQKELRDWLRAHPGHRRFSVISHPVVRAHRVFTRRILQTGPGVMRHIRATLRRAHRMPIPEEMPDPGYDLAAHRTAFKAFLAFIRANLAGQTATRIDSNWENQANALQGFGEFGAPDVVIREQDLADMLPMVALMVGRADVPAVAEGAPDTPFTLDQIYDDEIEALARSAYARDYVTFGFAPWAGG